MNDPKEPRNPGNGAGHGAEIAVDFDDGVSVTPSSDHVAPAYTTPVGGVGGASLGRSQFGWFEGRSPVEPIPPPIVGPPGDPPTPKEGEILVD